MKRLIYKKDAIDNRLRLSIAIRYQRQEPL